MSEFAFTGLGLNPHGQALSNPLAPHRAPGGSSGGAAASIARGQAFAALGTDTGGSVRIPAAFCGLVGFKPTQRRVGREGVYPLSPTLDSVGPIARTVSCCRRIDALIGSAPGSGAGGPRSAETPRSLAGAVIGVPHDPMLGDLEPEVARSFERALLRLEAAGARLLRVAFTPLEEVGAVQARGSLASAEAYAFHRRQGHLARADEIDPEVRVRILAGGRISAADYLDLLEARARLRGEADRLTEGLDALALPTTPAPAPLVQDLTDSGAFQAENARALRLPSVFNFLDRCAISLPMAPEGDAALGLMLAGETLGDERLFDLAEAAEPLLA